MKEEDSFIITWAEMYSIRNERTFTIHKNVNQASLSYERFFPQYQQLDFIRHQ
jgi:hypothetical protein